MDRLLDAKADYSRRKKGCLGTLFEFLNSQAGSSLLAVALTELVDLLGGLQDVLLAGINGCDWLEISSFNNGYSLPSSHVMVSRVGTVDLVRIAKSDEISWNTTSLYSG